MPQSLQEKFQICVPSNYEEDPGPWVPFNSQFDARKSPTKGYKPTDADAYDARQFNNMPPGMDIDGDGVLPNVVINPMRLVFAGQTDVSGDVNGESIAEGFTKRKMSCTEDQYTGEHMDMFYGDADGFVERNNYLDRL